jgi:hypothetical protein
MEAMLDAEYPSTRHYTILTGATEAEVVPALQAQLFHSPLHDFDRCNSKILRIRKAHLGRSFAKFLATRFLRKIAVDLRNLCSCCPACGPGHAWQTVRAPTLTDEAAPLQEDSTGAPSGAPTLYASLSYCAIALRLLLAVRTFIGLGIILTSPERRIKLSWSGCRDVIRAVRLAALDYAAVVCSSPIAGNETRLWEDAQVSSFLSGAELQFN